MRSFLTSHWFPGGDGVKGSDRHGPNEAKPLEEVFAERLAFEHKLIADRMAWLLTLNGFLVAAAAVLMANGDTFAGTTVLNAALLAVGVLGTTSNASCAFSNYWGTRAIRETCATLVAAWHTLPDDDREERRIRMRLYGRDPRSCVDEHRSPPSVVFHPWLMLPLAFCTFFVLLPFRSGGVRSDDTDLPVWVTSLALLPLVLLAVVALLDARFHLRRHAVQLATAHADRFGCGGVPTWPQVRARYYAERRALRAWCAKQAPHGVPAVRRWRWSVIPDDTYAAYLAAEN